MSTRLKKLTALALSCLVLAGSTNVQIFAATSVSGVLSGTPTSGYVSKSSSSATAVTVFNRTGGTRCASVDVHYWWGEGRYYTAADASTTNAGGVSATATKKLGGAEVTGAIGYHLVVHNGTPWGVKVTKIGTQSIYAVQR